VLLAPRSAINHTEKYNVVMFIEKIVFAKSYSAQLQRSRAGAGELGGSPPASETAASRWGRAMESATLVRGGGLARAELSCPGHLRSASFAVRQARSHFVDGKANALKIQDMHLLVPRLALIGLLLPMGMACNRERRTATRAPTTSSPDDRTTNRDRTAQSTWDSSAGPVLIVHSDPPSPDSSAQIVFPQYSDSATTDTVHLDPTPLRGAVIDLFGRGGRVGQARIGNANVIDWTESDCLEWPEASIRAVGRGPLPPWSVAFYAGRVQGVKLDSLSALPHADSARLAAEVTHLASALPNDTALSFRGLPFEVRDAFRFRLPTGGNAVVANLVRKLNQEANPLEQHVSIVAERDSSDGIYRPAYFERASGTEETIETIDLLAVVVLSSHQPVLVTLHEGYETSGYALLERTEQGQWVVRWTSVHTGC
jgi:hypothetical protein